MTESEGCAMGLTGVLDATLARLMADVLGWDDARVAEEVARCRRLVAAERATLAEAKTLHLTAG
ncbi:hypothetical protein [Nonomuraea marmarensis]